MLHKDRLETNFLSMVETLDPQLNMLSVSYRYRDLDHTVEFSIPTIIQDCGLGLFDENTAETVAAYILERIKGGLNEIS